MECFKKCHEYSNQALGPNSFCHFRIWEKWLSVIVNFYPVGNACTKSEAIVHRFSSQ